MSGINPVADAYSKSLTAGMLQLQQAGALAGAAAPKAAQAGEGGFQDLLAQAIGQTVELQKASEAKTKAFLTGEADDLHEVMIASEKAGLAFQLTLQVRNKMVEAYQEVMRMQI
jgi:flagellar hook-basal body complex protein FliE